MILRRILAVSRNEQIQKLLRPIGREIFIADGKEEAMDIIKMADPDLIVFDTEQDGAEFSQLCDDIADKNANVPLVVVGPVPHEYRDLMRQKAHSIVEDATDHNALQAVALELKRQIQRTGQDVDNGLFAEDFAASAGIVGRSEAIRQTLKMLRVVAKSRCNPVLVVGETGTGKELAARAIHDLRSPNKRFVAVNCAALTANLLESELFGHVKGSFTGANREKEGLLELAGKGTLFLDEISEMPTNLQAKLLRVLQEKTFRKVGGVRDLKCEATIIASSNRNLFRQTRRHRFRKDLYYRLNIYPVSIAPLRSKKRKEDIRLLAEYFLRTTDIHPDKNDRIGTFTKMAAEALEQHDWPGNVRELRNVVERAVMLETTDKIGLSSIVIDSDEETESTDSGKSRDLNDFSLKKAERELIARALQETGWQKTHAASLLGITRATLYAKVKEYNIIEKGSGEKRSGSSSVPSGQMVPSR